MREVVVGFGEIERAVAAVGGVLKAVRLGAGLIGRVEEVENLGVEGGVWVREELGVEHIEGVVDGCG